MLRPIESRIGEFDQFSLEASVPSIDGDAGADGDSLLRGHSVVTKARSLDVLSNALRCTQRALQVDLRKNDHEFFPKRARFALPLLKNCAAWIAVSEYCNISVAHIESSGLEYLVGAVPPVAVKPYQ